MPEMIFKITIDTRYVIVSPIFMMRRYLSSDFSIFASWAAQKDADAVVRTAVRQALEGVEEATE